MKGVAKLCIRCNKPYEAGERHRCQKQRRQRRDHRPSHKRGYNWDWRRLRRRLIEELSPINCHDCGMLCDGIIRKVEFHHIEKVADNPARRLDPSNLMPLCKPCHDLRTQRGE